MKASIVDLFCAVLFLGWAAMAAAGYGDVPASPLPRGNERQSGCRLDLSNELFGGVGDACVRGGLDRSRCCPVLAAWLFAAHARSALELPEEAEQDGVDGPMMPEDNEKCVESLQSALERRDIRLPRPNATCDTVLCFCGIHLHHIGTLRCPAAFNLSGGTAAPTAAVRRLERDCRNASYAGCSRCLRSLDKVKKGSEEGERRWGRRRRSGGEDVCVGLRADESDVAAGEEQDGVHPHGLGRPPRVALHRPPGGRRRKVQPRPGEHAARRRLPPIPALG